MATSSILHNVHIKDKKLAKSFVIALESAQGKIAKEVTMSKSVKELTGEQIREIFSE